MPIYHPQNPKNQHCFTHVHQKSQSHDAWLLRYIMRRREFFVILHIFPPLLLPLQPGKSKFWKNEKITWICHHFTRGPKITIIWCMLPEIWSATDRFCCHFGPALASLPQQQSRKLKFWKTEQNTWRYYNFPHVHHKLRSYDVWFQTYKAWPWISCHFGPFLHF